MHPHLVEIPLPGGRFLPLPSYGFMIAVGFLLCLYLLQKRGRRMGLNVEALFDMATIALLAGLVGSRVVYVVQHWESFRGNLWELAAVWRGGLAFYGGLLGGIAGLLYGVARRKLPLRPTLDAVASLVPLGHAFGRVGCFLNGCCYGAITASPLGIRFPRLMDARGHVTGSLAFLDHVNKGLLTLNDTQSLPVHPTQLYEAAFNLAVFGVLSHLLSRRRRAGDMAWIYGMCYGAGRFANEFLRADTSPIPGLGGITVFHLVSLALFGFGLVMWVRSRFLPAE